MIFTHSTAINWCLEPFGPSDILERCLKDFLHQDPQRIDICGWVGSWDYSARKIRIEHGPMVPERKEDPLPDRLPWCSACQSALPDQHSNEEFAILKMNIILLNIGGFFLTPWSPRPNSIPNQKNLSLHIQNSSWETFWTLKTCMVSGGTWRSLDVVEGYVFTFEKKN